MRKVAMLFSLLIFCLGVFTTYTTHAQGDRPGRACVQRCREQFEQAKEQCRQLPRRERRECLRRAHEQAEACVRACRS
jgi:hypothetical protein